MSCPKTARAEVTQKANAHDMERKQQQTNNNCLSVDHTSANDTASGQENTHST
jgi:hypothetical protein